MKIIYISAVLLGASALSSGSPVMGDRSVGHLAGLGSKFSKLKLAAKAVPGMMSNVATIHAPRKRAENVSPRAQDHARDRSVSKENEHESPSLRKSMNLFFLSLKHDAIEPVNPFFISVCGDGSCQFRAIAMAVGEEVIPTGTMNGFDRQRCQLRGCASKHETNAVRDNLAQQVEDMAPDEFIESHFLHYGSMDAAEKARQGYKTHMLASNHGMFDAKTPSEMATFIRKNNKYYGYWGDDFSLVQLSKFYRHRYRFHVVTPLLYKQAISTYCLAPHDDTTSPGKATPSTENEIRHIYLLKSAIHYDLLGRPEEPEPRTKANVYMMRVQFPEPLSKEQLRHMVFPELTKENKGNIEAVVEDGIKDDVAEENFVVEEDNKENIELDTEKVNVNIEAVIEDETKDDVAKEGTKVNMEQEDIGENVNIEMGALVTKESSDIQAGSMSSSDGTQTMSLKSFSSNENLSDTADSPII